MPPARRAPRPSEQRAKLQPRRPEGERRLLRLYGELVAIDREIEITDAETANDTTTACDARRVDELDNDACERQHRVRWQIQSSRPTAMAGLLVKAHAALLHADEAEEDGAAPVLAEALFVVRDVIRL